MKKNFLLTLLTLSLSIASFAQSSLNGIIKDEKGLPIEAATIQVKGTKIFKVADANGQFSIANPKQFPITLIVTSSGFQPVEVPINEIRDSVFTIILFTNTDLKELVITSRPGRNCTISSYSHFNCEWS